MTSTTTAQCTDTSFGWAFNTLNQSPCVIAGYLGGVCNGGQFNVPPLAADRVYLGPTLDTANPCRCSTVFYSLIAACSGCQDREYLKWSSYNSNCSAIYSKVFPSSIPAGTKVPNYAYLDVTAGDAFNVTAAAAAPGPESTAIPQSTGGTAGSSTSTSPTSTSAPSSSSSKAGPIAGGVVGGIVLLALIAALIFWWTRRRRNRVAPSSMVSASPVGAAGPYVAPAPMSFNNTSSFGATPPPKLYDPSDPSTYPSTAATSGVFTTHEQQQPFLHNNLTGSTYYDPGQGRRYTGAPEI